jgi:hypothetical protein
MIKDPKEMGLSAQSTKGSNSDVPGIPLIGGKYRTDRNSGHPASPRRPDDARLARAGEPVKTRPGALADISEV